MSRECKRANFDLKATTNCRRHRLAAPAAVSDTSEGIVSVQNLEIVPFEQPSDQHHKTVQIAARKICDTSQTADQLTPPRKPHNQQQENKKKFTPRNCLERIPITGLYNLLYAEREPEKWLWVVILLLATAGTLSYLVPSVTKFIAFKTVLDVQHNEESDLQFPPVYACATGGYNRTYVEGIFFAKWAELSGDRSLLRLARQLGTDVLALVLATVNYVTIMPTSDLTYVNESWIHAMNRVVYKTHLAYGSHALDISDLYDEAYSSCEKIIKNCRFNGIEFPCCAFGIKRYPAGQCLCFKFNVSIVSNSQTKCKNLKLNITYIGTEHTDDDVRLDVPAQQTPDMSAVFPSGLKATGSNQQQLTFESAIDNRDRLIYRYIEFSGLNLLIGNHITPFDTVYQIPISATSYVSVKRRRRQLLYSCMHQYHFNPMLHQGIQEELQTYFKNMTTPGQYSIEKCTTAQMLETLSIGCGCVPYYDTLRPNQTEICTPAQLYACYYGAFQSAVQIPVGKGRSKDVFLLLKERAMECLPLCETWDYEAQVTFVQSGEDEEYTEASQQKVVITVDAEYRSEVDILQIDVASFLSLIGDAFGLFLGLSFVAIIQAVYWLVAAAVLKGKISKVRATEAL